MLLEYAVLFFFQVVVRKCVARVTMTATPRAIAQFVTGAANDLECALQGTEHPAIRKFIRFNVHNNLAKRERKFGL